MGGGGGGGVVGGSSLQDDVYMKGPVPSNNSLEDGNYDNLSDIGVPDYPVSPTHIHHTLPYPPTHNLHQRPPPPTTLDPRVVNRNNINTTMSGGGYNSHYPNYSNTIASPQRSMLIRASPEKAGTPPPKALSTFRSEEEERAALLADAERSPPPAHGGVFKDFDGDPMNLPPPPPPLCTVVNGDTYAVVHKPPPAVPRKPVPLPILHPHPQNAQLFETGV
jgi:hypothetical protein